jgi:hypothetical protein
VLERNLVVSLSEILNFLPSDGADGSEAKLKFKLKKTGMKKIRKNHRKIPPIPVSHL